MSALEVLRLLAQDATAERLESATEDAEARELALRVRAGIDALKRREAELAALVDTARDLASLADPGVVLDAIVRRARALLGTEVAYLTLNDPERGDTFMRATAGSVSARFQALRLPVGAGLGGLVAQTRRPYWTADYPADERYRHTSEIDAAVGEEGLVAICGTPLLVDGQFVGVLFAANRSRRPFRHDEVALLGSLAALAAVSLVQTRRAAETTAALTALSAAHDGIQQAATAHDRFAHVVLGGGGVDDIASALGEVLSGRRDPSRGGAEERGRRASSRRGGREHCWVAVLDADGLRIASFGAAPPDDLADAPAVRRSADTLRLAGVEGLWAVTVSAAGQRLGALVLGGIPALDEGQGRTVERAAMVTALVLLFRLRAAEADHRVRADLLAELLARPDGGELDAALVERGRLLGLRLQNPHVVAVCHCGPTRPRGLLLADGLVGEHRGSVVVLVPGEDPSAVARDLTRLGEAATIGTAGPVVPGRGLLSTHAEARRAADALVALGMSGRGAAVGDLGFAGLVVGDTPDVDGYLGQVLGPVVAWDESRGSDLLGTLEAWFACGGSPRRAAGLLHVHANTVAQRLDRVAALLGEDWSTPERALEVQLALRLRRLRG